MPNQETTYTPAALAGISANTTYFVRNTGTDEVFVEVASAVPTNRDNAYPVPPGGDLYPRPAAGESIYVWSPRGFSHVVYEESL